jgi:hypothetical protein
VSSCCLRCATLSAVAWKRVLIAWFRTRKGEYGEGDKFNGVSVLKQLNPLKIVPVGTMARFADRS